MIHHLVAALLVQGNRILLGLRPPERELWPGVRDMFGGHVEPGEQPEQTLIRELQEELGITPTEWRELEIIRERMPAQHEQPADELIVHFYTVTAWQGTPSNRQSEEHATIEWFTYAGAVRLKLAHPSYPRLFAHGLPASTDPTDAA